jgi:hypothetical protein
MTASTGWDFVVRRADVRDHRTEPADPAVIDAPLADGELVLRVAALALTSNTLTYAVTGDALGYWQFYPAADGWGRIPAWGFAEVVASAHPGVAAGDRVFGYVPMSTHTRMRADRVRADSLVDATPHRRPLPAAYNFYRRTGRADAPLADDDFLLAALNPLFFTSFLIDDMLGELAWDTDGAIVVTSASSKTAFGTAFQLHARRPAARIVGLTSPRNRAFVERLAIYDAVLDYGQLAELTDAPVRVLDFAGNAQLSRQLAGALGDRLAHTLSIGLTHWTDVNPGKLGAARTGGGRTQAFFAPDRIAQRSQLWGAAGLQARFADAWSRFLPFARNLLRIEVASGPDALAQRYAAVTAGELAPDVVCIVQP